MDLQDNCRRLVEHKYFLDDKRKAENALKQKCFVTNSIPAHRFAANVIPFWTLKAKSNPQILFVNPTFVIGATINTYENNCAAQCTNINNNFYESSDYEKIGALPLYIAIEGKNRVRLFQQHQIDIRARVVQIGYPSHGELQLHKYVLSDNYALSCSNDLFIHQDNHTVLLLYPEITVPLFESYGVKRGKSIKDISMTNRKRLNLEEDLETNDFY